MEIYNVVLTNESAVILAVKHFPTKESAEAYLASEKEKDIENLVSVGWERNRFEVISGPQFYTVYFSDCFFHGEIVKSELELTIKTDGVN